MRDTGQCSVYASEFALRAMLERAHECPTVEMFGSHIVLPVERKFGSIESIQQYVDKVLALNWVQAHYPNARRSVSVRERRGQAFAHYSRWNAEIAIPPRAGNRAWAMREVVVLHELAHHLDKGSGHSASFRSAFTELISEIIGAEAGFILNCLFHQEGLST